VLNLQVTYNSVIYILNPKHPQNISVNKLASCNTKGHTNTNVEVSMVSNILPVSPKYLFHLEQFIKCLLGEKCDICEHKR